MRTYSTNTPAQVERELIAARAELDSLSRIDRLVGQAVLQVAARFDFHEHKVAFVVGYDIGFPGVARPVAFQNLESARLQKASRRPLPALSQIFVPTLSETFVELV